MSSHTLNCHAEIQTPGVAVFPKQGISCYALYVGIVRESEGDSTVNNNNSGHSGQARKTKTRRTTRRSVPVAPVTVTVHDPRTLKLAQELAAGRDVHIVGNADGSVSIVNRK